MPYFRWLLEPPGWLIAVSALLGAGLCASLLISSFMGPLDGRMWWVPVQDRVHRVTRPGRERKAGADSTEKWLAPHRAEPVDVRKALTLLDNLHSACLLPLTTDEHGLGVPTNLDELLDYPSCASHRATTIREALSS